MPTCMNVHVCVCVCVCVCVFMAFGSKETKYYPKHDEYKKNPKKSQGQQKDHLGCMLKHTVITSASMR